MSTDSAHSGPPRPTGTDSTQVADEAYSGLPGAWPGNDWLAEASLLAVEALAGHRHGDLPRWLEALNTIKQARSRGMTITDGRLCLGIPGGSAEIEPGLMQLHPWRKGPIDIAGITVDTEWRSDWKWERIARHVNLTGERILDVGCGNGYFGYRMLEQGARLVVGVDPTLLFVMQWLACQHFAGQPANYVLPLGIEQVPEGEPDFDRVFSMGVLYHRKDPMEHLLKLRSMMRTGGQLVLETLVLPDSEPNGMLIPEKRYAAMRNVWAIPGTQRLLNWVDEAGFSNVRVVDVTVTTTQEQRRTEWMQFESLQQALDPVDASLTREGYPAPRRAFVLAEK